MTEPFFNWAIAAKEKTEDLVLYIKTTRRNPSASKLDEPALTEAVTLLQMGLIVLLPMEERQRVPLPMISGNPGSGLCIAVANCMEVLLTCIDKEPSEDRRLIARTVVYLAADEFSKLGFEAYATEIWDLVKTQPIRPEFEPPGRNDGPNKG